MAFDSIGIPAALDFCATADVYCGRDHLAQRIDPARQRGEMVDLTAAAALGRVTWSDVTTLGLDGQDGRC